mgnify:CR=1 FL=1|tara:strand:+ start:22804 stop:23841 length:1038 start_codon:yes stop_codon:yes gene_type:complete
MSALSVSTPLRVLYLLLFTIAVFATPQFASASIVQSCGTTSVSIATRGTGMIMGFDPLVASESRLDYLGEGCAVISWTTSAPAASAVLFTELANEPVTIDLDAPNYGYSDASLQNNAGEVAHTAIIDGLEPGKAYAYRLVSRAHPTALPVISEARVLVAKREPTSIKPAPVTIDTPPPDSSTIVSIEATIEGDEVVALDTIPAALVAADSAFQDMSSENEMWQRLKDTIPTERLSLQSDVQLFARDRYIIPSLIIIGLLLLLYRYARSVVIHKLKNPYIYGLVVSAVITVLSATFMMYYVTLAGIAVFLGVLAWYLIASVPPEDDVDVKLLETKDAKRNYPTTEE